mmetsp:Transcript_13739/g.22900  ORF Transcript_13739/g.22900 Transcript_13739/m.22900 type:complete len:795 (+) Transcript_13739:126-2510(+)
MIVVLFVVLFILGVLFIDDAHAAFSCESATTITVARAGPVAISHSGEYMTIGSTSGALYYSSDRGVSFTASTSSISTNWVSVTMDHSGQHQIATPEAGYVYYSSDYGNNWIQSSMTSTSPNWAFVESDATGQYAIAGQDTGGTIYYSSDYGMTWTASSIGTGTWKAGASSYDGLVMYTIQNTNGYVYKSTDYGASWSQLNTQQGSWAAVTTDATGQNVIGGVDGNYAYYSTNFGVTWTATMTNAARQFASFASDATGKYVAVAVAPNGWININDNYGDPSNWVSSIEINTLWNSVAFSGAADLLIATVPSANNVHRRVCTGAPVPDPTPSPTTAPSLSPAVSAAEQQSRFSYTIKSGFGFAALIPATGAVVAWGKVSKDDYPAVDATSTEARVMVASGGVEIVASRTAFAVLKTGGLGVTAWGVEAAYIGAVAYETTYNAVSDLTANDGAFAAIGSGGGIITFGSAANGGNISDSTSSSYDNAVVQLLSSGVADITASAGAFAARKIDGSVYSWGNKFAGAGASTLSRPSLENVTKVVGARTAFAALTDAGGVVTFGDRYGGGDSSMVAAELSADVYNVVAAQSVFVAFKTDTSIVVWGNVYYGADTTAVAAQLTSGVEYVVYSGAALAALKADGSVVAWGKSDFGGDSTSVQVHLASGVVALSSTNRAFAALKNDGSVVVWGDANNGGYMSSAVAAQLSSGVTAIYATKRAFAALKGATGEVVLWGSAYHGGDAGSAAVASLLTSGVVSICSNDVAFTAIKGDGSAVVWGHSSSIPFPGLLTNAPNFVNATCA